MLSESIEVHVLGSTGKQYIATFVRADGLLHTTCTCQAGMNKTHCKHRLQLLGGNLTSVSDPAPEDLAIRLSTMLRGTQLEVAIEALAIAEAEAKASSDKLKRAKKLLDRVMHR